MDFIPYGTQYIDEEDIRAVVSVLRSGTLTNGPKTKEFENALCEATGSGYAVSVSSGTAALHLAAMAMRFEKGDEVILSPLTFAASANCILYCGGTPVFADIDSDTLLMDTEEVKKKITKKTRAIIAVHFGGECCDMESLTALADKNGLFLIQDAAHALGSKACGKPLGSFKGLQTWSFHPVKTITTGEGGAVTTNDSELYKKLRMFSFHGITRDSGLYTREDEGDWYYEQLGLGYNYRTTEIQCALGISQLKKLEWFSKRRAEIVKTYDDAFSQLPVEIQKTPVWSEPVRHLYTIRIQNSENRKAYFDALRQKGIGVNVHYQPVYLSPYYRELGYPLGLCPKAEDAYQRLITIPLYPVMTDTQVEYVIRSIKELLVRY